MPSITKYVWSALLGNVGGNTIPLHAVVTPLPAVLFPVAFTTDLVGSMVDRFPPNSIVTTLGARGLYAIGYYTSAVALIAAIPTAFTSVAEYFAISETRAPAVRKKALSHILMNVAIAGISLFNFLTKRKTVDFAPYKFNTVLSGVGFAIAGFSAILGGQLVFKYGVGVRRMGVSGPEMAASPLVNVNKDLEVELGLPTIAKPKTKLA
ncbi:hypothetical protein HDU86_007690 [Geranomyces michiganensis]|nr:hypothetical protein HDU86_007690 [Geranomyces michiganensis]